MDPISIHYVPSAGSRFSRENRENPAGKGLGLPCKNGKIPGYDLRSDPDGNSLLLLQEQGMRSRISFGAAWILQELLNPGNPNPWNILHPGALGIALFLK